MKREAYEKQRETVCQRRSVWWQALGDPAEWRPIILRRGVKAANRK